MLARVTKTRVEVRFVVVADETAPVAVKTSLAFVAEVRDAVHVPPVMRAVKKIIIIVIRPFVIGIRSNEMKAPPMMPKPMGNVRNPTLRGSLPERKS